MRIVVYFFFSAGCHLGTDGTGMYVVVSLVRGQRDRFPASPTQREGC